MEEYEAQLEAWADKALFAVFHPIQFNASKLEGRIDHAIRRARERLGWDASPDDIAAIECTIARLQSWRVCALAAESELHLVALPRASGLAFVVATRATRVLVRTFYAVDQALRSMTQYGHDYNSVLRVERRVFALHERGLVRGWNGSLLLPPMLPSGSESVTVSRPAPDFWLPSRVS